MDDTFLSHLNLSLNPEQSVNSMYESIRSTQLTVCIPHTTSPLSVASLQIRFDVTVLWMPLSSQPR